MGGLGPVRSQFFCSLETGLPSTRCAVIVVLAIALVATVVVIVSLLSLLGAGVLQVWSDGLTRDGIKQVTTNVVARFRDAPHGPPILGPPLTVLPPQFLHQVRISRPHPSEEGRGGCRCGPFYASGGEPTSLT